MPTRDRLGHKTKQGAKAIGNFGRHISIKGKVYKQCDLLYHSLLPPLSTTTNSAHPPLPLSSDNFSIKLAPSLCITETTIYIDNVNNIEYLVLTLIKH
jgi:hypothetical protein